MSLSLANNDSGADVQMMIPGDRFPVVPGPILRASRWVGGLFVQFIPQIDVNDWPVEVSDGINAAGFLMFPSEDYSPAGRRGGAGYRNYTSRQPAGVDAATFASGASTQTMLSGGGRYLFVHFETVSLTGGGARTGPPAVYALNDVLKVSENGLLCNDLNASLLAATGGTSVLSIGTVCNVPGPRTAGRLGLEFKF